MFLIYRNRYNIHKKLLTMGLVNSSRYTRMYDFRRDSWKQLIDKKYSKSWNTPERLPYLNTINEILEERIKNNGRHYLEQVSEYEKLKKHNQKVLVK